MSNYQINSEAFLSQINQGNFRIFNIVIAKILGSINSAVLFADLVDCQSYHKTRNELIFHEKHGDGWFFYTVEKCEERTTLTERQQSLAFSSLKEYGLVESANFGVPCKRHFKINVQAVFNLFNNSNNVCSSDIMSELEPTKGRNCNRHNVGTIYEPKNEPEKEKTYKKESEEEADASVRSFFADAKEDPSSLDPDEITKEKLFLMNHLPIEESEKIRIAEGLQLDNLEKCLACLAINGSEVANPRRWLFKCAQKRYWNNHDKNLLDQATSLNALKCCLFERCKALNVESCLSMSSDELCVSTPLGKVSIKLEDINFEKLHAFQRSLNACVKNTILNMWLNVNFINRQKSEFMFKFKIIPGDFDNENN